MLNAAIGLNQFFAHWRDCLVDAVFDVQRNLANAIFGSLRWLPGNRSAGLAGHIALHPGNRVGLARDC